MHSVLQLEVLCSTWVWSSVDLGSWYRARSSRETQLDPLDGSDVQSLANTDPW